MSPSQLSSATWKPPFKVWSWLSEHNAPFWLWSRFCRSTWRRCSMCGVRGFGRWKCGASYGGGQAPAHYCSQKCCAKAWEF